MGLALTPLMVPRFTVPILTAACVVSSVSTLLSICDTLSPCPDWLSFLRVKVMLPAFLHFPIS